MPKIAQNRILENQRRIEAAALELFTKQGFHGTNIREIAARAEVSIGAIYTYYPTKEALYVALVRHHRAQMEELRDQMLGSLEDVFSRSDLKQFAMKIRSYVYNHAEFWLLMYIDVIEFNNQHFADWFHNMPEQFRSRLGPVLERTRKHPGWCGQDPAFAFATVYLHVITYFLIERLFQGHHHLGVGDEEAMDRFVQLLLGGLWRPMRARLPASVKTNSEWKGLSKDRTRRIVMTKSSRA